MLTDHEVLLFASLLLSLLFLHHIRRVKQVWQAFGDLPAITLLLSPTAIFDVLLPRIPWIAGGPDFSWRNAYERQFPGVWFSYLAHRLYIGVFAASKSDTVQLRSLF